LRDKLLHDHLQPKIFFGKLFFAVAPFLYNSMLLADPILSGKTLTVRCIHKPMLARTNLARLE
jgi:hypothetical protein